MKPAEKLLSLGEFTLSGPHTLGGAGTSQKISVSVVNSISKVSPGYSGMRSAGGATRTLLITGVSRGLGKALALELAKRGHIIIGCARSQDKLSAFQSELASTTNPPSEDKHFLMNVDV